MLLSPELTAHVRRCVAVDRVLPHHLCSALVFLEWAAHVGRCVDVDRVPRSCPFLCSAPSSFPSSRRRTFVFVLMMSIAHHFCDFSVFYYSCSPSSGKCTLFVVVSTSTLCHYRSLSLFLLRLSLYGKRAVVVVFASVVFCSSVIISLSCLNRGGRALSSYVYISASCATSSYRL